MKSLITAAVVVLFASAAYAGDTYLLVVPQPAPKSADPGSYFIENVPVRQNPVDHGRINESPIRGKGRISVVHNEPAPGDPDAEITKAMWLLRDNGWQVYKPNDKVRR